MVMGVIGMRSMTLRTVQMKGNGGMVETDRGMTAAVGVEEAFGAPIHLLVLMQNAQLI